MAKKSSKSKPNNYVIARLKALPWAVIIVVSLVVLFVQAVIGTISTYNQLVVLNNGVDAQWQQVEVQYQRRLDLIPNLVSTVEAGQIQEKTVLTNLAEARTRYGTARTVNDQTAAANQIESSLGRLLVIIEAYPNLKSSELIQNLQAELAGTENKVGIERLRYNDDVRAYNTFAQVFPHNIVANVFNYEKKVYFEASPEAASAPKVKINN